MNTFSRRFSPAIIPFACLSLLVGTREATAANAKANAFRCNVPIVLTGMPVLGGTMTAALPVHASRHYVRLQVQDVTGALAFMSSPLYINFPEE